MPTRSDPTLTIRFTTEELAAVVLRAGAEGKRPGTWIREVVRAEIEGAVAGDPRPLATATADRSVESVTVRGRASASSPVPSRHAGARTLLELTKADVAMKMGLPVSAPVVGTKALSRIRRAGRDPGEAV